MMHKKRGYHRSKGDDGSSEKEGTSKRKEDRSILIGKRKSEQEKKDDGTKTKSQHDS